MSKKNSWVRAAGAIALAATAASAHAQAIYRCVNLMGSSYVSDRPCPSKAGTMGGMGPSHEVARRDPTPSYSYIPPVDKAPEHLAYLSANCASLNDAIRTGPSRGLQSAAMLELQSEYRKKCEDEDQAARQRVVQDRQAQRVARESTQAAAQAERSRAATSREQCDELLRILHGKRKKLDTMSPGEKADLQRFEASYNERCKSQ